jgi:hypothetical protein
MWTHTKIQAADGVWDPQTYYLNGNWEYMRRAARLGRNGFFRFVINASPEQADQLSEWLATHSRRGYCVQGACKALRVGLRMNRIPWIFTQNPTMNAVYLSTFGRMGKSPLVTRVEYHGKNPWLRLATAPKVAVDLFTFAYYPLPIIPIVIFFGKPIGAWLNSLTAGTAADDDDDRHEDEASAIMKP